MSETFTITDRLILKNPSAQNALDIFKGSWVSKLPEPYNNYEAGQTPLFDDPRVTISMQYLGSVIGKSVLDLGPLEGGIAYTLEKFGASNIVSVEANTIFYLKCLVIKEILGMRNTHFLCGDVIEYLKNTKNVFNWCIASGILYHLMDPVELLWQISHRANNLIVWTHYFTEDPIANRITTFREPTNHSSHGIVFQYHLQEYGHAFQSNIYCGGTTNTSNWMSKEDILLAVSTFGFKDIQIIEDTVSDNGPILFFVASNKYEICG